MPKTNVDERFSLIGIIQALMVSDNFGDVHEEIFHLCDLAGIPRPEGDFLEGWDYKGWNMDLAPDRDEDDDEDV